MSTVQFNLLPDVKREYIKSQGIKNKVTTIAIVASAISLGIVLILAFWVLLVQKKQLNDSANQISSTTQSLKTEPNIGKILTVQNQLYTLSNLHSTKHITSRMFTYLTQLTPANVNLSQLSIDTAANTITLSGTANSASSVNQLIDTLKFANYTIGSDTTNHPAFSSVVENSFSIGSSNVSYSLTAQFDPNLFSNNLKDSTGAVVAPKLQVPGQTTTRSALSDPGTIFNSGTGAH